MRPRASSTIGRVDKTHPGVLQPTKTHGPRWVRPERLLEERDCDHGLAAAKNLTKQAECRGVGHTGGPFVGRIEAQWTDNDCVRLRLLCLSQSTKPGRG